MRISDWSSDVCSSDLAAHRAGRVTAVISFHVCSQQRNTAAWDAAVASASEIFQIMAQRGIRLTLVNLGGGFPARYRGDEPAAERYGLAIRESILRHFGNRLPETIIEQIGRASCRERVCKYVSISVVAVSLKQKHARHKTI